MKIVQFIGLGLFPLPGEKHRIKRAQEEARLLLLNAKSIEEKDDRE